MNPFLLLQSPTSETTPLPPPPPTESTRYPRHPLDIYRTRLLLRRACPRLPDELFLPILYYADYDCIHFTSSIDAEDRRRSLSGPTRFIPYLESPPLDFLSRGGRIRTVRLRVTGRDQGWADNPASTPQSWFQAGRRGAEGGRAAERTDAVGVEKGPVWAFNAVARKEWQVHEVIWDVRDEGDPGFSGFGSWVREVQDGLWGEERAGEGLGERVRKLKDRAWGHQWRISAGWDWMRKLGDGDRVCIVPMAMYAAWQCQVRDAMIDVEVQVWGAGMRRPEA